MVNGVKIHTMENSDIIFVSSDEGHDTEDFSTFLKHASNDFIIISPVKYSSKSKIQRKFSAKRRNPFVEEPKTRNKADGKRVKKIRKPAKKLKLNNKILKSVLYPSSHSSSEQVGNCYENPSHEESADTATSGGLPIKEAPHTNMQAICSSNTSFVVTKSELKIVNNTFVDLKNLKWKFARKKMGTNAENGLQGYLDQGFKLSFINSLINNSTDRRLPSLSVINNTMDILKTSMDLLVSFKARECLHRLSVLGLINYENFPMTFEKIAELVNDVSSKHFSDEILWLNSYWLLEGILVIFERDSLRYRNSPRLSLVRKFFIPTSNRYDYVHRLFRNVYTIMSNWSSHDVFDLCRDDMIVSLDFKHVFLTIQKFMFMYVRACDFMTSAVYEYQRCYEGLQCIDQKNIFLSTIPDIKLKILLLDLILETLHGTVNEYDKKLSLKKIVYVHYERLPPRHLDTKLPEGQSTLFSSEEVEEFVFLCSSLTDLYIRNYSETLTEDEVQIMNDMESIVGRLTKSLEEIVVNGTLLIRTKLKLRSLSKVGILIRSRCG